VGVYSAPPDPLAGKGGWAPRKGDPREGEGRKKREGRGRGKLLPPDVRFYG